MDPILKIKITFDHEDLVKTLSLLLQALGFIIC